MERNAVSAFPNDQDHPHTDYFGVEDDARGLAIFDEGLYEYEQMTDDRNTLALALLRSIGRISGPYEEEKAMTNSMKAVGDFILGEHKCDFSLMPYTGNRADAKVTAKSIQFISPVKAICQAVNQNRFVGGKAFVQDSGTAQNFFRPLERADKIVPEQMNFVSVSSSIPEAMVVTAVKTAENSQGAIVRLLNSTSPPVSFTPKCENNPKKA